MLVCRSPRGRSASDITIVSQLSMDRLEVLGQQCGAWGGVTSAAVYLPLLVEQSPLQHAASVAEARAALSAFHAATEAAGAPPPPRGGPRDTPICLRRPDCPPAASLPHSCCA